MKKLTKLISIVGISLSCAFSNPVFSQQYPYKTEQHGTFKTKDGTYNTRTVYYNKDGPHLGTHKTVYSNKNYNKNKTNYSNKNNISVDDVVTGVAIVGGALWLINKLANSKKRNYVVQENKPLENNKYIPLKLEEKIKKIPEYVKNYGKDWFKKSEEENKDWYNEGTTKKEAWYSNNAVNKKNKNWWAINNEIFNFKKDFQGAMKGDKKVYIKYISPLLNKGAKTIAEKGIPGGSMIYEIVREGPDNFWLKKVEDSEKISGEFETKGDKVAGGIEMIIDDLTGNYRKKVYDITKSSFKFWEEVEGEKIKRKYGENSKEYLNWIVTGSKEDPIAY